MRMNNVQQKEKRSELEHGCLLQYKPKPNDYRLVNFMQNSTETNSLWACLIKI